MKIKNSNQTLINSLFLFVFMGTFQLLNAQTATRTTAPDTSLTAIESRLVELALNGPTMKEAVHRNKINEYMVKAAKNTWVNMFTISVNYNDQSFAKNTGTNTYVYPKYYFGFTLPLGTLLSKTQVRAAEEQVKISISNEEQLKRNIRAEVLAKYKQYRALGQLIVIQRELIDDVQAALITSEENFRKGTITIEAYNTAQRNKNDESSRLINLQLEQDLAKIDLERMIGQSLESVIR